MPDIPNGPGSEDLPYTLGAWVEPKDQKDARRYKMARFIPGLELPEKATRSSAYYRVQGPLNQYHTSSCVGHSGRHYQLAHPNPTALKSGEIRPVEKLDPGLWPAVENYFGAQEDDPWPGGEYPGASPQYEGSSLSGLAKYLQAQGVIDGAYAWFETPAEITNYLLSGLGPVMFASRWYSSMFKPDAQGFVHATGSIEGGHAYFIFGVDEGKNWHCLNSWGPGFGLKDQLYTDVDGVQEKVIGGVFKISPEDQKKLFSDGDAEAFAPVKLVPLVPPVEDRVKVPASLLGRYPGRYFGKKLNIQVNKTDRWKADPV